LTENDPEFLSRFDTTEHWSSFPIEWEAASPDALLSSDQLAHCLNICIEALPTLQAATLNLKERQGYSLKDICKILDVSESNVRVLLHRARNKLFQVIEHFQITGKCGTS
jgi:RNA polymerase sigma-70 factor (ECF subfamily)